MKMLLSLCLLLFGLNSFAAGYDTLAIEKCGEEADKSVQLSLDWEYEAGDGYTKQSYIAQTKASEVIVDDNGLEVELKIVVTSFTLNDDGSKSNASFIFDAFYNSRTETCLLEVNDYEQVWCESNCIK